MSKIIRNILCISIILVISLMPMTFAFSDIDNHWAKEAIVELTDRGVLDGFEDGTFRPNENVTREQFAKILVEALKLKANESSIGFTDVASDRWSHDYIQVASKYLTGYRNNDELYFRPTESSVREDVAVAVVLASGLGDETPNLELLNQFSDKDEISENLKKYVAIAVEHEIMRGKGGYFDPQGNLTRAEVSQLLLNISEKVVIDEIKFDEEEMLGKITSIKKWINIEEAYTGQIKINGRTRDLVAWDGQNRGIFYWYGISDSLDYNSNYIEFEVPVEDIKIDADFFDVDIFAQVIDDKYLVLRAGAKGTFTKEVRLYDENLNFLHSFIIEETVSALIGDVNNDGKLNSKDNNLLMRHLKGENVSVDLKNADTNKDGKVDEIDSKILHAYIEGTPGLRLPHTCTTIVTKYRKTSAKDEHQNVTICACGIELLIINEKHEFVNNKCACGFEEKKETILGDVNEDGEITLLDSRIVFSYLNEDPSLDTSKYNWDNADVNDDGKITFDDSEIIRGYFMKQIDELPHKCNIISKSEKIDNENHKTVTQCTCGKLKRESEETHNIINGKCACGFEENEEEAILGDINGDGEITLLDTRLVFSYLNEDPSLDASKYNWDNADVNADGIIDVLDADAIYRMFVEKETANN